VDSAGNLYVGTLYNHTIRKLTPDENELGGDDPGRTAGRFRHCRRNEQRRSVSLSLGPGVGQRGEPLCGDQDTTIRKLTPDGTNWVVTTLAGLPGVRGYADGTNRVARFWDACGVVVDTNGNLYVAEYGNSTIRKVNRLRQTGW